MKATIIYKYKGIKQTTLNNVSKIKVGSLRIDPEYVDDDVKNALCASDKDISITHKNGVFFIAKNTYLTISIEDEIQDQ